MSQELDYESRPTLGPRVDSLDLLRGVAILGIFLMNTQSMLLANPAYTNPTTNGLEFSGANAATYIFTHLFADMKFITIFSFMFGAGIMLQGERVASRGMSPWAVHYTRMAVLLGIALIHAYGIWYGDILTTYVLCGMLLFPLRRLYPGLLVALGLMFVGTELFVSYAQHHGGMGNVHPFRELNALSTKIWDMLGGLDEASAYTGLWKDELRYRGISSLHYQTVDFATWSFWRCGGAMLIGMGLQRWRFFHGQWGKAAYWTIALFGIFTGVAITGLGIIYNTYDAQWDNDILWSYGMHFNYVGSLIQALGYMALGVLVALRVATPDSRILKYIVIPVRAVGKTALSNYIFQSLVGTTLAYAHIISPTLRLGLGWYDKLGREKLLPIVLCVWAFQLMASTIWTHFFRQGPLEWFWHKLVYLGRPYPLRPQESPVLAASSGIP